MPLNRWIATRRLLARLMSPASRRKQSDGSARCLVAAAERLEYRQLLSASPITAISALRDHTRAAGLDQQAAAATTSSPYPLDQTFLLHSRASATKTIYLDFNGHTTSGTLWNTQYTGGASFTTPAYSLDASAAFSDTELAAIQQIWQRVMEDFSPFDVDVTTQDPGVESLRKTGGTDTRWGIRVVIGGSSSQWFGDPAGGVSFVGDFTWSSDTPSYVFSTTLGNAEKDVAEAASHEVGHALGLDHDGRIVPPEDYYAGSGTGDTGWAPIMGVGYYENLTQWSKGEYPNANNTQDDLSIITTRNGFGYRTDDYGSTVALAGTLTVTNGAFSTSGVIERGTDKDVFKFTTAGTGSVTVNVQPFERGPNLDVLVQLLNSSGTVIASSNPPDRLDASITTTLAAGTYYVQIDGVGKGTPQTGGYSDYGSLGQYTLSGTVAATTSQSADLATYQPTGWSGPIVVSTTTGTNLDATTITSTQSVFVDVAAMNQGNAAAGQFSLRLTLDGTTVNTWTVVALNAGATLQQLDVSLGSLSVGSHTLVLTVDSGGQVTESNESNNSYTKTFTVGSVSVTADLVPFKPAGATSLLVLSNTSGTNADSYTFPSGQTVYIDYAVKNAGTSAVSSFAVRLSMDGQVIGSWTASPLSPGAVYQVQDFAIIKPADGLRALTLMIDAGNQITETSEANNSVTKSIVVGTAGTNGVLLVDDHNRDSIPDLALVKQSGNPSGRTDLQVLNGSSQYQSVLLTTPTALPVTGDEGAFDFADFNRDGVLDLAYIKKFNTGSNRTELHVLDGASGYQTYLRHTILPLANTGGEAEYQVGDFNGDGVPDLAYIKKFNTGSNRTELHVLDGASGYQTWLRHTILPLSNTGSEAEFRIGQFNADNVPDLAYIKKFNTGSNETEVHVLDGASSYQTWIQHTATALHATGDEADFDFAQFDADGVLDLAYVKKYDTGSNRVELHVLDGGTQYRTFTQHTATPLPAMPPTGSAAGSTANGMEPNTTNRLPADLFQSPARRNADSVAASHSERRLNPHSPLLTDLDALFADAAELNEILLTVAGSR